MSRADADARPRSAPPSRRARALVLGVVLALTAPVAACASSGYGDSLDAWTRSQDFYRATEVRAAARATLEVEPFRRAYVAEYARIFSLTPDQRDALLEAQLEEARTGFSVIVALYAADPAWNDLDPRHGIWEVRLEGPRGWLPVRQVRRLDPRNPTWQRLFPYYGAHYRLYELRFDRGTGGPDGVLARPGEELGLVIAGAPGQLRLGWRLP